MKLFSITLIQIQPFITSRRLILYVVLQLPMVLKVPRLNFSPLALCDRPFSLLGFGDILVPGKNYFMMNPFLILCTC